MQKTKTVRGVTFSGQKIAALMSADNMTNGCDYIIQLNGEKFFANYRQIQDAHFAPVCNRQDANTISLMPDDGSFRWAIWVEFDPSPAAALGSMTSAAKAAAARRNGRKGGRPKGS